MSTIFALSSGRGKAGVSIIRISGPQAAQAIFALGIKNLPKSRIATFAKLKNGEEIIDHGLVLYFNGPNSFTGEEIVELHLHGSIAVVENVLNVLGKIKTFRVAEPGEFSKRAFENNKMDLVQAEGLADLIEAETSAQARQALRSMEGETSRIYESWRERVIEIMAFVEAYIDFPDENIPADLDIQAQEKVRKIISEIEKQIANDNGERVRLGAVATIIGAPNVGKSTLINFLSKRDVAIVSDIAGTTRDALEVHLNIDGFPLTVIDTAGIRESGDKIEQEGVRRALEKAEKADFRIVMFEGKDPSAASAEIKKYLYDENSILVQNKIDIKDYHFGHKRKEIIGISLKEKKGLVKLQKRIKVMVEKVLGNTENAIITRKRHRLALQDCVAELEAFISARKNKLPIELCAESLRRASFYLGKITGKIGVEDILGKIFSEFCIGK